MAVNKQMDLDRVALAGEHVRRRLKSLTAKRRCILAAPIGSRRARNLNVAHIEVTEEELIAGSFPLICAKTGEPTGRLVELAITIMPKWSRVLLVLGVLPWFIARPFAGRKIVARIPLQDDLAEKVGRSRSDLVAALFGGLVATMMGFFIPRDDLQVGLVAAGFLIVVGSLVALAMAERDYGIDLRPTKWETVVMRRIHGRFRDALVRGDVRINESSVEEIINTAHAAIAAPDPWG